MLFEEYGGGEVLALQMYLVHAQLLKKLSMG